MTGMLRMAWRNLWRHRARSLLMMGIVFLGSLVVIVLWGVAEGAFQSMIDTHVKVDEGALTLMSANYREDPAPAQGFSPQELDEVLDAVRDVQGAHASPRMVANGMVRSPYGATGMQIRGVDPAREKEVTQLEDRLKEGRYIEAQGEAMLGLQAARNLDVRLGERVVVNAQGEAGARSQAFTVVGIYQAGMGRLDESTVIVSIAEARRLAGVEGATQVSVSLPRLRDDARVAAALRERLGQGVEVLTFEEANPMIASIIEVNIQEMVLIMIVLAILAGFGVANTVMFSVIERTREFGVMRSLGMPSRRLAMVVVTEAVLASLLGFAAAAVAGYVLVLYLAQVGIPLGPMDALVAQYGIPDTLRAAVSAWYWGASLIVVVATAVLAAWLPARRAARLQPVEAIRAE